ncbi:hypothetical protein PENTCL1PPCAC_12935, partial [Pristionchus entomophagus]
ASIIVVLVVLAHTRIGTAALPLRAACAAAAHSLPLQQLVQQLQRIQGRLVTEHARGAPENRRGRGAPAVWIPGLGPCERRWWGRGAVVRRRIGTRRPAGVHAGRVVQHTVVTGAATAATRRQRVVRGLGLDHQGVRKDTVGLL